MTEHSNEITVTKEMVQQYEAKRTQEFIDAVSALCNEYERDLVPVPQLTEDGRTIAILNVRVRHGA